MKINIKPPQHPEAKALVMATEKKIKQLFKDHSMVMEADVRFQHGTNDLSDKHCEIYMKLKDRNIFVKEQGQSFDSSLKKAVVKIETQIKHISNQA